jgi:hypothetical protein
LSSPNRLNRVAALVAIVAGSVFVAAVIFGTGVLVGAHSGGHREAFERSGHESSESATVESKRGGLPAGEICWSPVAVARVGTATTATRVAMPVRSSGLRFSH